MIFIILTLVIGTDLMRSANTGVLFTILIIWSYASTATAYLFSGLFKKKMLAQVFGFMYILLMYAAAFPLTAFVNVVHMNRFLLLFPPIAYIRALSQAFLSGTSTIPNGSDLQICLVFLFVIGTLFLFLALYLNTAKYEGSYLWCFRRSSFNSNQVPKTVTPDDEIPKEVELAAYRAENDPIESMDVCTRRLRMVFPPQSSEKDPFVAVDSLSLGINSGECFGLLGPNGAGKTTTINCLTGMLNASSGDGYIAGRHIEKERELVYNNIGVCPQFDVVFSELTVGQHLFFYARLKGIGTKYENALVQTVAASVELDGDAFHLKASELSGGLKRRLSIAISLIGDPKVWILDEPSTGLAPDARRTVWDIVEAQKVLGRTIIITTHSMEEADTLCSRIGIMAKGRLRCIGTQDQLKDQYGDGFLLSLSCDRTYESDTHVSSPLSPSSSSSPSSPSTRDGKRGDERQLRTFIQSVSPSVELHSCQGHVVKYMIPSTATDEMLGLFRVLEVQRSLLKDTFGIEEWELGQTTLEQVFIRAVEHTFEGSD